MKATIAVGEESMFLVSFERLQKGWADGGGSKVNKAPPPSPYKTFAMKPQSTPRNQ